MEITAAATTRDCKTFIHRQFMTLEESYQNIQQTRNHWHDIALLLCLDNSRKYFSPSDLHHWPQLWRICQPAHDESAGQLLTSTSMEGFLICESPHGPNNGRTLSLKIGAHTWSTRPQSAKLHRKDLKSNIYRHSLDSARIHRWTLLSLCWSAHTFVQRRLSSNWGPPNSYSLNIHHCFHLIQLCLAGRGVKYNIAINVGFAAGIAFKALAFK